MKVASQTSNVNYSKNSPLMQCYVDYLKAVICNRLATDRIEKTEVSDKSNSEPVVRFSVSVQINFKFTIPNETPEWHLAFEQEALQETAKQLNIEISFFKLEKSPETPCRYFFISRSDSANNQSSALLQSFKAKNQTLDRVNETLKALITQLNADQTDVPVAKAMLEELLVPQNPAPIPEKERTAIDYIKAQVYHRLAAGEFERENNPTLLLLVAYKTFFYYKANELRSCDVTSTAVTELNLETKSLKFQHDTSMHYQSSWHFLLVGYRDSEDSLNSCIASLEQEHRTTDKMDHAFVQFLMANQMRTKIVETYNTNRSRGSIFSISAPKTFTTLGLNEQIEKLRADNQKKPAGDEGKTLRELGLNPRRPKY